ncbi:MAG: YqcC family protein [Pseudomonadota bacterium]|nr:YqcC family protein [Pseudomonadota bacterium]
MPSAKLINGITAEEFQRYDTLTYVVFKPLIYCALKIEAYSGSGEVVNQANSSRHLAFIKALEKLEAVMQQDGVWPNDVPNDQALKNAIGSEVPFAADCFSFEAWLAFIFIPKMRILLSQSHPIPAMQITPAAEVYLSPANQRTLSALQYIDDIASGDIG